MVYARVFVGEGGWLLHSSPTNRGALKDLVMTVVIQTAEQWRWIEVCGRERVEVNKEQRKRPVFSWAASERLS